MNTIIDNIKFEVKNWWVSLLLGLFYIAVSLFLMFTPMASYVALSILFAIFMFVSGTLEIVFSISNKDNLSSWGWYLACGILDLLIGIYLMANVGLSMEVLPFVVAFWLMFRGFSACAYSLDLKRYGTHGWGWYMAFGVMAVLCSMAIIWQPGIGAMATVYLIAYTLLFIGIFRLMLSFELKGIHKRFKSNNETTE